MQDNETEVFNKLEELFVSTAFNAMLIANKTLTTEEIIYNSAKAGFEMARFVYKQRIARLALELKENEFIQRSGETEEQMYQRILEKRKFNQDLATFKRQVNAV